MLWLIANDSKTTIVKKHTKSYVLVFFALNPSIWMSLFKDDVRDEAGGGEGGDVALCIHVLSWLSCCVLSCLEWMNMTTPCKVLSCSFKPDKTRHSKQCVWSTFGDVNGTGLALPSLEATHAIAASTIRGGRDLHVSYPGNRHEVFPILETVSRSFLSWKPSRPMFTFPSSLLLVFIFVFVLFLPHMSLVHVPCLIVVLFFILCLYLLMSCCRSLCLCVCLSLSLSLSLSLCFRLRLCLLMSCCLCIILRRCLCTVYFFFIAHWK